MQKKLTLTIDQQIVEQAKRYAKKRHKSVSRIVEEYLRRISTGEIKSDNSKVNKNPLTDSITGMFSSEYQGEDYDSVLENALMEKHL